MQIPEIPTGTMLFTLALVLTVFVGIYMNTHPEELNLCLTFMGGVYTGFLGATLDLTKLVKLNEKPKDGDGK